MLIGFLQKKRIDRVSWVDERPSVARLLLRVFLQLQSAAIVLLDTTSCTVGPSNSFYDALVDSVSMCGHATVHYTDGRNIEWHGGRSVALCDWENADTHEKGVATLGGFDINSDSGVSNTPVDIDVNSKTWAGFVTNNIPTTYLIRGTRMGIHLPVTVSGEATITPLGESEVTISGFQYVVKRYSDKAEAYSPIGHDTILSEVTLIKMPSGGYIPGERNFAPESHFARVLVRPPEHVKIESIHFEAH